MVSRVLAADIALPNIVLLRLYYLLVCLSDFLIYERSLEKEAQLAALT
jgi:hypothetical protein